MKYENVCDNFISQIRKLGYSTCVCNYKRLKKAQWQWGQYIKHVSIAKDKLASAGEKPRDSQIILIALGGLGSEYKPFVTSITIRFDHSITFTQFQQLLMDHDLQEEQTNYIEANAVSKTEKFDERNTNIKSHPCQICSRKEHGAINCYNRVNFTRFPLTHNRKLIPIGIGNTSSPSVNTVTIWYPDSGATTHITSNGKILNSSKKYKGSEKVIATNRELMVIPYSGKCKLS